MSATMKRTTYYFFSLLVLTSACREDDDPDSVGDTDGTADTDGESGGDGADDTGTAAVTFWDDVAPIYFDNCVTCHREGGIAPFSLDNYADAKTWAGATALAVSERTMPPWLVTSDGSCGEFADSRALDDDAIDTITGWVESEQAEGTPRDDLTVPELDGLDDASSYSTPEFTPEIVGGPLAEFDEYRCFLVEPGMDRDTYLTGYDVLPGNEAIVHHVLAVVVDPDDEGAPGMTNRETIEAYDADSPDRAGWPCFEGAGPETSDKSIPVVWAPGQGAVQYPDGTGVAVAEDDMIVLQVHYNLANPANIGMSDQTEVQLRFEDEVEKPGLMLLPDLFLETLFGEEPATLPPGEESVKYQWDIPLAFVLPDFGTETMKLYGVLPHMHEFGRSIDLRISGPEGDQCAAEVQSWDFAWQLAYFYEQPYTLTADHVLSVTCDYDTQNASEAITPGWGTQNEMCLMGMFVVPE